MEQGVSTMVQCDCGVTSCRGRRLVIDPVVRYKTHATLFVQSFIAQRCVTQMENHSTSDTETIEDSDIIRI